MMTSVVCQVDHQNQRATLSVDRFRTSGVAKHDIFTMFISEVCVLSNI